MWGGLQLAGVLGLALGLLIGAPAMMLAGAGLLIVGGCIWLNVTVQRIMD